MYRLTPVLLRFSTRLLATKRRAHGADISAEADTLQPVRVKDGKLLLYLAISPRAQKSSVSGIDKNAVHMRIAATPHKGKANDEVIGFVADLLDIPRSAVCLVAGQRSRYKTVELPKGITPDRVLDILHSQL